MQEVNFLLTGSSGFFGKIIERILSPTHSIYTLSRSPASNCSCDLSAGVPELNQDIRFINVIHAAAKAHVIPKNQKQAEEFIQVNFQATIYLTQALEKLRALPERFVFISTVAVYGKEQGEQIAEDQALLGDTPYAKSKILAEEYLTTWCSGHAVQLTILRLPLLVGINPPGNLGAIIRWMQRRLYVGMGSGNAKRSMVLAEDVAKFIPHIMMIGGVFNLTDGYNPSIREVEKTIANRMGRNAPVRVPEALIRSIAWVGDLLGAWFPVNSNRYRKLICSLTFSDEKARKLAGWNPRPVLDNLQVGE